MYRYYVVRRRKYPCPTSPSLFHYSDEERPKLYIQVYVRANQHADIPSNS